MVRLASENPQKLAFSLETDVAAKLQLNTPIESQQGSHVLSASHNSENDSFTSAHSEHEHSDDAVSETDGDEDEDDDSLADFIVNDSADEAELRRGSPRRRRPPSPPRSRRRRMVIESDSEDDEDSNKSLQLPRKERDGLIVFSEDEADDLMPQVVALRLSSPGVREVLGELPNSPSAAPEPTKASTKQLPSQDYDVENDIKPVEFLNDEDSEPEVSLATKPPTARSGACTKSKSAAAEKQRQRAFASIRGPMAQQWLDELDATITDGQLAQRTAHTGGVVIVWSARMRQTAGQALSRRSKTGEWSCTITLSSSLINDEDRLYNTVAHEFAHLAVGLQMGKPKPHGPEFFAVGAAIAAAFPARRIIFGRCHRYDVQFKYAWQCAGSSANADSSGAAADTASSNGCGALFQRHSKSLDTVRMRCGRCRGRLVQVRPAPDTGAKALSTYQSFVKARFADVKQALEVQGHASSAKEVMREVSRLWNIEKERRKVGDAEKESGRGARENDLDELDGFDQLDLRDEVWSDAVEDVPREQEAEELVAGVCDEEVNVAQGATQSVS